MSDEQKWIEAVNSGEIEEFRHIVTKYANALFAVAYGVLGDYHRAEDAAQESFLQAFLRLSELREPGKLGSWLYAVVYRQSIRMLKKNKRVEVKLGLVESIPEPVSVEATVIQNEVRAEVRHALGELDEVNRITTALYYISGMSMKEIADFLGVTVRAVESRLQRAKKQLRALLQAFDDPTVGRKKLGHSFEQRVMRELPKLVRIPCIFVEVRDIDHSMKWYEQVLGIDFDSRAPLGGMNISFVNTADPAPSPYPVLTFATPNIEQAFHALQRQQIYINRYNEKERTLTFEDPDGHVIAFVEEKYFKS